MNKKTKNILCGLGIGSLVFIGILFNHSSYDVSWYVPESVQQQESIARGKLNIFGPFAYFIEFDGSVVSPASFANDVRTGTIDGIMVLLGGLFAWNIFQKKNS